MTTNAGSTGTTFGGKPQDTPAALPQEPRQPTVPASTIIAQRKEAPRNENVFISVRDGGLRPSWALKANAFMRELAAAPTSMPKLSAKDQRLHDEYWAKRLAEAEALVESGEFDRLVRRLQLLVAHGVRGIFVTANGKSVGKTRLTQMVLATIQTHTGCSVVGMTSTLNNATATLSRMSDIEPSARLPVERFAEMLDELETYAEMSAAIPRTQADHVAIIGEGRKSASERSTYSTAAFIKNVLELVPNFDFVGLDLGNDGVQDGSVPLWAMRLAHAALLVLNQDDAVTTGTFLEDVAVYRTDRESGPALKRELLDGISVRAKFTSNLEELIATAAKAQASNDQDAAADATAQYALVEQIAELERNKREGLTGLGIATPQKIAHSVVVCNRSNAVDEPLISAQMRPHGSVDSSGELDWEGVAKHLPEDAWLLGKSPNHEPNPTILGKLAPKTRRAALEITVTLLEQMAILQGINVPDTDKTKPAVVVDYTK